MSPTSSKKQVRSVRAATAERLHSGAIHLLRRLRQVDVAAGITPARLSALSVLAYGGVRTLGELAELEQVKAPTMSRLVAAMEVEGLVLRAADPEDGRVTHLRASAKGLRVLGRARDERLALLEELIGNLPKAEQQQLASAADLIEKLATQSL